MSLFFTRLTLLGGIALGLAACTQAGSADLMTSALTVGDPQLKQSVPFKRLALMNDVDKLALMGIAAQVDNKCALVEMNPDMKPIIRPVINRVGVFQGREKLRAAQDGQDRAFDAKYGFSLRQTGDLCPVAKREIAEQGALAAFWVNKGL